MTARRRILCICIALLIMCSVWISALAAGRYAASKESTVYHRANCHYVDNILRSNLIWFATIQQAEAAGYRACRRCHPDWLDWEFNPDSGEDSDKDNGSSGNRNESSITIPKATKPTTPSKGQPEEESHLDIGTIIACCVYGGYGLLLVFEFFGTARRKPKNTQKNRPSTPIAKEDKSAPPVNTNIGSENGEKFQSSFIAAATYSNGTLYLTFTNGSRYAYQNVPKSVYNELLEAPSKGKCFHEKINGIYPYYIPK